MSVKLPPQSPTLPPTTTHTSHVHPHANGGKKSVRGKGTQPGELVHEESYSDKVDESASRKLDGRRAASLGAALNQPQSNSAMGRRSGTLQRSVTGHRQGSAPEADELKQQASATKHHLANLLLRVSGDVGHSARAQHAVDGFHHKVSLGHQISLGSPQLERAQQAFEGLDTKLSLGHALERGSAHLPAAAQVLAAFDARLGSQAQ